MCYRHPECKEIINITEDIILIEGHEYHRITPEIKIIAQLVRIVDRLTDTKPPAHKPIFALTTFINNQLVTMANITLVLGTPKTGIFTLLDASLNPISGVTFSNQVAGANSNLELATFALDGSNPNNLIATPLLAGSGTITISTDATYVDPVDGQTKTSSFSVTKNYTVGGTPSGVSFDILFT